MSFAGIHVPFLIYLPEKSLEDIREAVLAVAKVRSQETNIPLPPRRLRWKLMCFPDSEATTCYVSWFNFFCVNHNVIFKNQNSLHITMRQSRFTGPDKNKHKQIYSILKSKLDRMTNELNSLLHLILINLCFNLKLIPSVTRKCQKY